ncbi:MAG: hypothetical protein AABY22_24480, partial [Nanoarchaeota archaeon]
MRKVKTFVVLRSTVKIETKALKGILLPYSTGYRYTNLDARLRKYHQNGFTIFEKLDGIKCEKI